MEEIEPKSTLQRHVSIATPIKEKFQPNMEKSQHATPIIEKFKPNMEKSQHNVENFDIQTVKIKHNKMRKRVSTQSK